MPQFGGKDSKRHFTVVMGGKEHGLYISSTPSSAARKAVTKLCAANKSKKVEFSIREITQGSKKKTYGPYEGYIEKLKEPIELKGRVIRYKPVAKLNGKKGVQKGGYIENIISTDYTSYNGIINGLNKLTPEQKEILGFRYSDTAEAFIKYKTCYMWRLRINNILPYYIILKIKSSGSSIYIAFYLEEPKPAAEENPKTTIIAIGNGKKNFLDNLVKSEKNNKLINLIKDSEDYYTSADADKYAMTQSEFYQLKFEVSGSTQ
jgi:hypothetical protein